MAKVALIDRYGAFLSAREGRFQLYVKGEKLWDAAPVELDTIVFTVGGASVSARAIKLACDYGIDVVFMERDRPFARVIQASYGSTFKTWLHQLKKARKGEERLRLAKSFIEGKLHNQRAIIADYYKYYRASGRPYHQLSSAVDYLNKSLERLQSASSVDEVIEVEAHAAREYWKCVASLLPPEVGFTQRLPRSRRPPGAGVDSFNIALNVGYGILKVKAWSAVLTSGLNPYVGFLHKPRAGKAVLVFDLMEEFRPVAVDRPLIAAFRRDHKQFEGLKEGNRESIRSVWRVVVERLRDGKPPLENAILEQARLLAKHVRGTGAYEPYKVKW